MSWCWCSAQPEIFGKKMIQLNMIGRHKPTTIKLSYLSIFGGYPPVAEEHIPDSPVCATGKTDSIKSTIAPNFQKPTSSIPLFRSPEPQSDSLICCLHLLLKPCAAMLLLPFYCDFWHCQVAFNCLLLFILVVRVGILSLSCLRFTGISMGQCNHLSCCCFYWHMILWIFSVLFVSSCR